MREGSIVGREGGRAEVSRCASRAERLWRCEVDEVYERVEPVESWEGAKEEKGS